MKEDVLLICLPKEIKKNIKSSGADQSGLRSMFDFIQLRNQKLYKVMVWMVYSCVKKTRPK